LIVVIEPVFTMHDKLLGCSVPLVVHVGCASAGNGTIDMLSVEKSPSGI
jgi:hypothetical protein